MHKLVGVDCMTVGAQDSQVVSGVVLVIPVYVIDLQDDRSILPRFVETAHRAAIVALLQ